MVGSKKVGQIVAIIILVLCSIVFLLPIFYLFINSFKSMEEIMRSFIALPTSWTLDNYINAWKQIDYPKIFLNTLFLTVGSVVITVLFSSLAGYKLQRTKGRLSQFLKIFFAFGMLIPFTVIMVPMSQLFNTMGITNNLPALLFVYAAIYMPMMISIYIGYCKGLPVELDEAAMIDGCNQFQVFTKIILPLSKPILVTIAVLSAVSTWNDLVVELIAVDASPLMNITRRVNNFIGVTNSTQWDFFTAAVALSMIPIIILYAVLQKQIQKSITAGAVKG